MKKAWTWTILGTLAAAAAIYWTVESGPPSARGTAADSERRMVPEIRLTDVMGQSLTSEKLRGKVLILDIWATYCPPCRLEIPGFVRLQKQYGPKGLQVVGLSVDDGPEVVREFMAELNINYPIAMATRELIEALGGADVIPTTFIVDRSGRIVERHVGYIDSGTFEEQIASLLE